MTYKEFHTAFNIQLDKAESISHPAFISKEKDYWINTAIRNIAKTRFSGTNPLRKGFQQDQKRTDDLRFLVVTNSYFEDQMNHEMDNISGINNYMIELPSNYWFTVGETCLITSNKTDWPKNIDETPVIKPMDVTECTIDNITSKMNNSLSDHRLRNNKAKPLRLFTDNIILLYTEDTYSIFEYDLTYIKKPKVFKRISTGENYNEDDQYDGMPEHIHDEIVAYAVRLALGSIGDERYQIQSTENQIIE